MARSGLSTPRRCAGESWRSCTDVVGTDSRVYSFLQHVLTGLAAGTVYALVALGYTMVYGVLKLINFAHGDVMMVGVYVGYAVAFLLGRDVLGAWWVAVLVFAIAM